MPFTRAPNCATAPHRLTFELRENPCETAIMLPWPSRDSQIHSFQACWPHSKEWRQIEIWSGRSSIARVELLYKWSIPQSLLVPLLKGMVWIYPLLRALTEHG